jgi:predicted enzyme related to lactoylglutathione lyase
MSETAAIGGLRQVARTVRDIGVATEFYGAILGLKHLFTFGPRAFFELGSVRLYLEETQQPGPESILYFAVDDIAATHVALGARGVEFVGPPQLIHRHEDGREEWMAFFKDPEGRTLALASVVTPG